MARALKTAGMEELSRLRARARRQHAMGRIGREDCDYIVEHLDAVEARITSMTERGVDREI